jgi:hypothetical protein
MPVLQAVYLQVVKAPITETIRSSKKQWEDFLARIPSIQWHPAFAGIDPSLRGWMSGAERVAKGTMMNIVGKNRDEVVGKGTGNVKPNDFSPLAPGGGLAAHEARGGHLIARHVGKTDAELLQRLKDNPKIAGASPFTDRATAEKVASEVLNDPNNKKIIQAWLSNPKIKSTLVLPYQ